MASLELDKPSGRFRIRFRYAGEAYKRSLETDDRREAQAILGRVEETLRLLDRGRLEIPADADPGSFILSDGKPNGKPSSPRTMTVKSLLQSYQKSIPEGAKADTTLRTEETHVSHLLNHLPVGRSAQTVTTAEMQRYVDKRLCDKYRGKRIGPGTVKKEVATFRLIWNWGVTQGSVVGPAPTIGLKYPRTEQKPPFMIWEEIHRIIERAGLKAGRRSELWSCLFLTTAQIQEVLDRVKETAQHRFIFPMFVFAAHTGARRSEIRRSQIDDFDFRSQTVLIRERKRSHDRSLTYRRVRMSDLVAKTMKDWFSQHPGGEYTISSPLQMLRGKTSEIAMPLTPSEAHDHFKRALKGSKWSKIRGFHVFRHSFASNLAAAGVDQRIIDEWMGHQTDEMRKRYRHLFPDQQQKVIDSVFGGNGK